MLYDRVAYSVGGKRPGLWHMVNPLHAARINDLQWEAAHDNIFASLATAPSDLERDGAQWRNLREPARVTASRVVTQDNHFGKKTVVGFGSRPSKVDLDLAFVRPRIAPPPWADTHPPLRGPWISEIIDMAHGVQEGTVAITTYLAKSVVDARRRAGLPDRW